MTDTITLKLPRPHVGQLRVIESAKRFNVLMCGRRFGKTTLGIHLVARKSLEGHPVAWFAPTYKLLSEPWRTLKRILAPVTASVNVQERRIELITGGSVDFWTLDNDDPARGRKYARVVVDEAGLVRNFDSAWFGAIRPTLSDFRGDAFIVGTPKGQGVFYGMYMRGKNGSDPAWAAFNGSMRDNPFVPIEESDNLKRELPPDIYEQEVNGIPIKGSANPFGQAAIERNTRPLSDLPPVVFGVDLAVSEDWTVIVGLDHTGTVCKFDRFQRRPWPETMATIAAMIGDTPATVDCTGVGKPIVDDLQRECGNVTGFTFTGPSKRELMGKLCVAIQTDAVGYPAGPIVDELESFEVIFSAGGANYSAPSGLHDDCVCALALAVYAKGDVVERWGGASII